MMLKIVFVCATLFAALSVAQDVVDEDALGMEAFDYEHSQAEHEFGRAFSFSTAGMKKRGHVFEDEYIDPAHAKIYYAWKAEQAERKRQSVYDTSKQKSSNSYTGTRLTSNDPKAWNQNCGTCVYHATTGVLEAAVLRLATEYTQIYLSKQMLVDTADNDGKDDRCSGWHCSKMLNWMASKPRRAQGGLYPGPNGRSADHCGKDCPKKSYNWWCGNRYWPVVQPVEKCSGWWIFETCSGSVSIGEDRDDLKNALKAYGPIAVHIHTKAGNGVSADAGAGKIWKCDRGLSVNHAVLLVGWGPGYFLIKNSWGPNWGEGGYFRASNTQSWWSGDKCIRGAWAAAKLKVWTSGWNYKGSTKRQGVNETNLLSQTLDAESLTFFESLTQEDLQNDTATEASHFEEIAKEHLPIGGGLPLRTLVSSSSKLVAFTAPDTNDPNITNLDALYATLTIGPLGNAAFIAAEDITFTIDANIVANYAPMQQLVTEVNGVKAMKLGSGVSAFMIEFLPQDEAQFSGIDLTPMKLLQVGVEVTVIKVLSNGIDATQNFDLGTWQPVLLLENEEGETKSILRHEMCIADEQRAFLNELGAVRQIKVTLKVPKVDLPSSIVGQNKTFKVHIERFALSTCGALFQATGSQSDQLAVSADELNANKSLSSGVLAAIIVVAAVAIMIVIAGGAYVMYSRRQSASGESLSARHSVISVSERRSSRRAGAHHAGSGRTSVRSGGRASSKMFSPVSM